MIDILYVILVLSVPFMAGAWIGRETAPKSDKVYADFGRLIATNMLDVAQSRRFTGDWGTSRIAHKIDYAGHTVTLSIEVAA